MNRKKLEILVVAGEASGDVLGAKLVEEIRRLEPDSRFYGAVGEQMAAAGVEADLEIDSWSVTGIVPVVLAVPAFLSRLRQIKRIANERKPELVLLIDFPEFNLKLAKALKKRGHRVVYYVSPQLWAWRKYRAKTIGAHVDLLLSILPFEKKWYEDRGIINVAYVGNPIVDKVAPATSKEEFCRRFGLDPAKPITVSACENTGPPRANTKRARVRSLEPKATKNPPEILRKAIFSAIPVEHGP